MFKGFVAQNVTVYITIPTTPATIYGPIASVNGWITVFSRFIGGWPTGKTYADYITGFGVVNSNFWLGLDYIYELTNTAFNGGHTYRARLELLFTPANK